MANIVVTGASGFLGSHIADALSESGHAVTLVDLVKSPFLRADQKMLMGNITDADFIMAALKGADAVYHLAALADLNEAKTKPLATVGVNIGGTINVLEACRQNKVKRLLFGSSVYVYSKYGGFYRCSKQACENYIEEYQNRYGLDYTILRYGSLYGTRTDETNGVYRLLKQFMTEETLNYDGSKEDKREYIHVEDAARLSVQALETHYANKHLTLTGNDRLSINDLFKMFEEILDKKVTVGFEEDENNKSGHYSMTPYTFIPKLGKKLVSNEYVDMGQGIIQVVEMIHNEMNNPN
jgi:UDP-glucose 4-epimerase